jgi:hypothetical protein
MKYQNNNMKYRLRKATNRVIITQDGTKEIAHFLPGQEELAQKTLEFLNNIKEPDPVIPPGVKIFTNKGGSLWYYDPYKTYENWVKYHLDMKHIIHTISVNGTEWSVDEWYNHGGKEHYQIKAFYWDADRGWRIETVDESYCYLLEALKMNKGKLPPPIPICQLPDENGNMVDMFLNDPYWLVNPNTYEIHKVSISPCINPNGFTTKAAAEKYVFDKQPFYPRGLVEPVMGWLENPLADNLKAFKEKHLKDKV